MSHQIPKIGKRWTLAEDLRLMDWYETGEPLSEIAAEFGCSTPEVERRINHMKVIGAGLNAPAPTGPIRTSTGLVIGGAYIKPAPPLSEDGDRLQAALLKKPRAGPWARLGAAIRGLVHP